MSGYQLGQDMARVLTLLEGIMATQQELVQALADLKAEQAADNAAIQAALDTEQAQIADAFASMQQAITDLEALVAAGTVTPAQWQSFIDEVNAAKDQAAAARATLVQDIENTVTPPAPPVIEP